MSEEGLIKFHTELDQLIDKFKIESNKHKLMHRYLKYCVFGLTGCSTILSGLALAFPGYVSWLNAGVLLTSVGVTLASSLEGLRKPSELWVLERNVFHSLCDLKRELNLRVANGEKALDFETYFQRLQSILSASTEHWTRFTKQEKQAQNSKGD